MKTQRLTSNYFPILLILPAIGMLVSLTIFPVLWSLFTSLKDMTLLDLMTGSGKFVGLKNYLKVFLVNYAEITLEDTA